MQRPLRARSAWHDPFIGGSMIVAVLTVVFGAVAIAIGFGLSRRAQDTEWRSDPWDQAGAMLKMLVSSGVLLGFAFLVRPSLLDPTQRIHPPTAGILNPVASAEKATDAAENVSARAGEDSQR